MLAALQHRANQAAHIFLVGIFFCFPISLAATNILMALMLASWLLAAQYKTRWNSVKSNPITLPALMLYGLVIVGTTYSVASSAEMPQHLNKYSKFLFVLMAITLLQEPAWRQRCWNAFGVAMLFTLASVYANIWFDLPWSVTHNQGWGVDHTVFKDYISQGIMMALFVLWCIHQSLQAIQPTKRLVWGALALLALVSITHLSAGRTAYLALFLSLFVYGISRINSRKKWLLMGTAAAMVMLLIGSSATLSQRVQSVVTETQHFLSGSKDGSSQHMLTSTGARLAMWQLSIEEIKQRPLIGAGTGSYRHLAKQAFTDPTLCGIACVHPHNQFLFFGVEYGLLGIAVYLFYFYRAGRFANTLTLAQQSLLLGFLGIFFVDSMVHGALWLAVESHFFTFMMALFMATPASPQTKKEPFGSSVVDHSRSPSC
jgi:O-antigen ligase